MHTGVIINHNSETYQPTNQQPTNHAPNTPKLPRVHLTNMV